MDSSYKIDWLTITHLYDRGYFNTPTGAVTALKTARTILTQCTWIGGTNWKVISRKEPFYQHHYMSDEGIVLSLSELQSQGVRLIYSGSSIPVGEGEQRKIWNGLFNDHWRITRADLAVDFMNGKNEIIDLWTNGIDKQALKRRHKSNLILSPNGDTIEIGARKSDKFLRLYDKGKEQHTELNWKRWELEIKHKTAKQLPHDYDEAVRALTSSMIAMIDIIPDEELSVLEAIAQGASVLTKGAPKTRGNKEIWLNEQVLPALKRLKHEQPQLFDSFIEKLIELGV